MWFKCADTFWGCILSLGAHMRNSSLSSACNMICSHYLITFPEIILSFSTIPVYKIIQSMENLRESGGERVCMSPGAYTKNESSSSACNMLWSHSTMPFSSQSPKNIGKSSKKIEREGGERGCMSFGAHTSAESSSSTCNMFQYSWPFLWFSTHSPLYPSKNYRNAQ